MKETGYRNPNDPMHNVFQTAWKANVNQFAWSKDHPDDGGVCVDGADEGAVADTPGFSGPQTRQVIHLQFLELRDGYGCRNGGWEN